jgi:hypothetical protein
MKTRTELLQYLIDLFGLDRYLEIGVQNGVNFHQIRVKDKISVDPDPNAHATFQMTSDEFFSQFFIPRDIVFIDGLHHSDQVKKDFENVLFSLEDHGFIVFHDALPAEQIHSLVPRQSKIWNGDVYKFIFQLNNYDGINFITADFDHGCTIVWKDAGCKASPISGEIDWNFYQGNKELLRVKTDEEVAEVLSKINSFER